MRAGVNLDPYIAYGLARAGDKAVIRAGGNKTPIAFGVAVDMFAVGFCCQCEITIFANGIVKLMNFAVTFFNRSAIDSPAETDRNFA